MSIASGIGAVAGKAMGALGINRAWLTLLMVAIGAASLYVAWARTNAQRQALASWIDVACASAGKPWQPPEGSRDKPGAQCKAEIASLAAFRADTTRVTAETLANAAGERDAKLIAETARTRRAAEDARAAAQSMEDANAALKNDRVSGAWWDAFNHAAGMRAPAS